jgi:hypothetical protein
MNFPTSSIGLPQSLKYDLPPSFSDSARAYSVNVAPDGITQVVGPALPNPLFTANSGTAFGAFNSQTVSFTIPSCNSGAKKLSPKLKLRLMVIKKRKIIKILLLNHFMLNFIHLKSV